VWHDGANGGTGYYGGAREKRTIDKLTYYDWPNTWALTRRLQPDAVIFSDAGPDIRWVGNEKGFASETSWATFDPRGEHGGPGAPGDVDTKESGAGTRDGKHWIPAECDVSIRPGWFWHPEENSKVRDVANLSELYFKSVGRGASMLLNVPPDRRGQFHDADVKSLRGFGLWREQTFSHNLASGARCKASNVRGHNARYGPDNLLAPGRDTYWATDDTVRTAEVILEPKQPATFDIIRLREPIQLGQRVRAVAIDSWDSGSWHQIATTTSIGNCRLIQLPSPVTTPRLRLRITESAASPALAEFGLFARWR
jgi:alpha-L-fucosidase